MWNCRGAANKEFRRNLPEVIAAHDPIIMVLVLVLMETITSRVTYI